jgi:ubiquinone/menaquinone biosynthesis C-methylase UbiE
MRESELLSIRCPLDGKKLHIQFRAKQVNNDLVNGILSCDGAHEWNVVEGIPSLAVMDDVSEENLKWLRQYDKQAEEYDETIKFYDTFLQTDVMKERGQLLSIVPLEAGTRVVDIGIGTAANFIAMDTVNPAKMKKAQLHGIDLSWGMLKVAQRKLQARRLHVVLIHADLNKRYPFPDDYFDTVIHTGGINTFSDKPRAFSEMLRICTPGGIVIVADEGLSPSQEQTEFGQNINCPE